VTFRVNATSALRLIDARLFQGFMRHTTFNSDPKRGSTFMSIRWGMDERRQDGHKAGDFAYHQGARRKHQGNFAGRATRGRIYRARLLNEMVALLPEDTTTFRKAFQKIEEVGSRMLNLRFTNGSTTLASSVIGCDGVKSKVRHYVSGSTIQPQYVNECAFRAMVPGSEATNTLGDDLALNSQLYSSYRGYRGYIVTYPVEHGKFINMAAMPHDGSPASTWSQDDWTVSTNAAEIREKFQGWHPPLIELISRHQLPSKWTLFTLQHDAPYFEGRMSSQ
jgi:salicylate hydroxylase